MKRITITVDAAAYTELEHIARREGVPASRLVREAMEQYVVRRQAEEPRRPLPLFVGIADGPGDDIGGRVDELVGEAVDEAYRTEILGQPRRASKEPG